MFKVGDYAFYPTLGVGRIDRIETRNVGGVECKYFIICIVERGDRVMVPVNNVDSVGLRPLMKARAVADIYDVLREPPDLATFRTWNQRFREYMLKMKTGDPFEIARVMRDLVILSKSKELSFGEKKLLDQARRLLVKEIAVITDAAEDVVAEDVHGMITFKISTPVS